MLLLGFVLSCCLAWPSAAQVPLPKLKEAYERELRELLETKRSLEQTLKQLRVANRRRTGALQAEVRSSMAQLSGLRKGSVDAEEELKGLKRRWKTAREYKDLLQGTLELGTRTLQKELPDERLEGDTPARIRMLFVKGTDYLLRSSSVHKSIETFFGLDGKQVNGTVVHVGEVAALGVASQEGGVLLRLPGGSLRLLPMQKGDFAAAKDLVSGRVRDSVPVYLFDPLSKGKKAPAAKNQWGMLQAGGPIAWIILALGAFGVVLLLERWWTLAWISLGSQRRWEESLKLAASGEWEAVSQRVQKMGVAAPVLQGLVNQEGAPREVLEQSASEALLEQMPTLERSHAILNVLVTVAPLLGLLGTVTGMISTFDVITTHGTGNPRLLSQGISEALITTELGLAVAIPLLLAKSVFVRWSDRLLEGTQLRALLLIQHLQPKQQEEQEG